MKTITKITAGVLVGLLAVGAVNAQESDSKVKKGQMRLVIDEDNNGKIKKFDSTFTLEDKAKIEAILKAKGIDWNADDSETHSFHVKTGNNAFIMINDEELDGEDAEKIKVIRFDSDSENGEAVNIELIVNEAIEKAQEMSNSFEFHTDGGEEGERKVIIMKNGEKMNGNEFEFKHSGDGEETVIIKKFILSEDEDGEVSEMITEIKNQAMVFIIKTDKEGAEKESLLPTKIEEEKLKNLEISKLKLYPNPTNGEFNMSFKSTKEKDILISITDTKGAIVYEKELKNFKGKFNEDFDLSNQEKGLYFFNIVTDGEKETRKIIVQ